MNQIVTEIVGVCKRIIWDIRDLRDDVRDNDKSSHFVNKMRSLDDFQRIIAIHGLKDEDPLYELCVVGSKCIAKGKTRRIFTYMRLMNASRGIHDQEINQIRIRNNLSPIPIQETTSVINQSLIDDIIRAVTKSSK